MAQYGNQYEVRPGTVYGFGKEIVESKLAAVDFEWGHPIFYKTGDDAKAYAPDSTDATRKFAGVFPLKQISFKASAGVLPTGEQIDVLREGEIWVQVITGETGIANKPAYVDNVTGSGTYKQFSAVSTSKYATGGIFKTNPMVVEGKTVAVLELRGLA